MKRYSLFLSLLALLLLMVQPLHAQDRSVFWERWDVNITNVDTTNNRFDVEEIYRVRFDGSFRFGTVQIPADRLEGINNFAVRIEGEPLRSECSGLGGTFCYEYNSMDGYNLTYYFFRPINNTTLDIEISYRVFGALRVYPDGDQLWWDAIPDEHFGFAIGASRVTVELPREYAPREGIDPVVTYGAPGEVRVNGSTVVAEAVEGVGPYDSFSIRIQYPHNPNAQPPQWQAAFDEQREFDENVRPLLDLGALGVSLLVLVGGLLFTFVQYQTRGRDPQTGPVPEYLSEPPSDLSPAMVGTLVDERADVRDVISLITDLARKGYLVIEESKQEGLFGTSSSKFVFKRTDKEFDDLQRFERVFAQRLFGQSDERTLDSLRNRFYTTIPEVQREIYSAVAEAGFFNGSPENTRNNWVGAGVGLMVLAFVIGFIGLGAVDFGSIFLLCIPAAFGAVGLGLASVGSYMPAKTRLGAEEAAKWRAFRNYLARLEQFSDVESAADRFSDFLPYAVAFGLERQWVNRFRGVPMNTMPPWYYPTYMGPYRRGYIPRTPIPSQSAAFPPGELARAGGDFSLDDMSENMARGLESFSNGLTTMLDSASRAMTSRPQQTGSSGSWGSGGRSFSGGGFRGGGGSGGGGRGFG